MLITSCNRISLPAGGTVERHAHEAEHEFHYLCHGSGSLAVPGHRRRFKPGTLLFSRPGEFHTFSLDEGVEGAFYFVRFQPDPALDPVLRTIARRVAGRQGALEVGAREQPFFERLRQLAQRREPLLATAAGHLLQAFLCQLAHAGAGAPESAAAPCVEAAMQTMQRQVYGTLRIADLAAAARLSPAHFSRLFHRQTGQSPRNYYFRLKLETAAYLLRHTPLTIKEIAARLQFYDEFHFSRLFKAETGHPPSHARRNASRRQEHQVGGVKRQRQRVAGARPLPRVG